MVKGTEGGREAEAEEKKRKGNSRRVEGGAQGRMEEKEKYMRGWKGGGDRV